MLMCSKAANTGLVVAELELERETQSFEKPPWAGKEVTLDRFFGNSYLARHPFMTWNDTQRSTLEG
jgi:adenylate cyclase